MSWEGRERKIAMLRAKGHAMKSCVRTLLKKNTEPALALKVCRGIKDTCSGGGHRSGGGFRKCFRKKVAAAAVKMKAYNRDR